MSSLVRKHLKSCFERIFVRTNFLTMEKQNCRVGAVTPITSGAHAIAILEYRYQNFIEKAADTTYMGTTLGDFFERKAQNFKKLLESLS